MPRPPRITAALAPALAAGLSGLRWWMQGSGNVYTDPSHGYYRPDPDLGWRFVAEGPLWLGLEVIAGLVGFAAVVAWIGRRLDRRDAPSSIWAGKALWVVALASLALPIAALASGLPPAGAVDVRPEPQIEAPSDGIVVSLPGLAAGRYAVVEDPALGVIVATVSAGGEEFESRFGGLAGHFEGDPGDLRRPVEVVIEADPRTVDTGVEARSNHAHEYLQVESFDRMRLEVRELTATEAGADAAITFAARGELTFIGDVLPVELSGTLRALDEGARTRLGLGAGHAIRVTAGFSLPIATTKLSSSASDFSSERIPIRVELILVQASPQQPNE